MSAARDHFDVRSPFRWWVSICTFVRRGAVDRGHEPEQIERELDDRVAAVVATVSSRLLGQPVPMRLLDAGELRRIAVYIASKIDAGSDRYPHYPSGWRGELAAVLPDDKPAREPGEDTDEQ